jgi:hypothetical protein
MATFQSLIGRSQLPPGRPAAAVASSRSDTFRQKIG